MFAIAEIKGHQYKVSEGDKLLISRVADAKEGEKIKFDEVSFSYSESKPVFDKLNLSINSGEKVAIVGSTGSGKTTLINLILRFYESNSGSIFIDNKNIKDIDLKNLRSQISLVTQDIFLFADSIFNNITLFNPNISIDDVKKAAKEIGIHDFINKLPGGYHYNVRERGVMLSEGQKQLISFLRAYLSNPRILILDEATSSLNKDYEDVLSNYNYLYNILIAFAHQLMRFSKTKM